MAVTNPTIIETIARAMADELENNGACVKGDLRECLIDGGLLVMHDIAQAVLIALEQSGHAIVPIEPTEAMEEAARDVPFIAMGNGDYLEPDRSDIYRAMIQAGKVKP